MSDPRKRRPLGPGRPQPGAPLVRRGTVRLPVEVASKLRIGHPWVYREVLANRPLREKSGDVVELVDPSGDFVARGIYDEEAIIAIRVMTRSQNDVVGRDLAA